MNTEPMHQTTAQQHRTYNNTGVLWKSRYYEGEKSEKDRDSNGDATIDGIEYWVSGWTRAKKNGEKYIKLYFTKKKRQGNAEAGRAEHGAS